MSRIALRLLATWIANCLGLLLAAALVSQISYGHRAGTLLLAGLILAAVNVALRPLVVLMALPAVIMTLGAALLLVNTLMLWLTSEIVTGLHVGGFWSTLAGALLISIVNLALRPWKRAGRRRGRRAARRREQAGR